MKPPSSERKPSGQTGAASTVRGGRRSVRRRFNFMALAVEQVIFRVGWVFKTESVIMPAVLDMLGGSGFVRGWLPVLNRFGQSIAPLAIAGRMRAAPRKKFMLSSSCLAMGISLVTVAGVWAAADRWPGPWALVVFLALYAVFFCAVGVNHFAYGLLVGKLVPARRRGRLMTASSMLGVAFSVGLVLWLLPKWLTPDHGNFTAIFLMAGCCFLACAAWGLVLAERRDLWVYKKRTLRGWMKSTWQTLERDANFRRLAAASALFGASMALFPHYQAVARQQLHVTLDHLVTFVVVQNLGIAVFSLPLGWTADRHGNRRVLAFLMIGLCAAPGLCLALAAGGTAMAAWFWLVFVFVGLTPIAIRMFNNYTLEVAPRAEHARYLVALNLSMALPTIVLSPIVGALIDLLGFAPVFVVTMAGLLLGWWLALGLEEPRQRRKSWRGAEN